MQQTTFENIVENGEIGRKLFRIYSIVLRLFIEILHIYFLLDSFHIMSSTAKGEYVNYNMLSQLV